MLPYILLTLLCVLLALAVVTTSDGALYDGSTDAAAQPETTAVESHARHVLCDVPTERGRRVPRLCGSAEALRMRQVPGRLPVDSSAVARQLAANPRIGKAAFYDSRCGDAWGAVRWYRGRYDQHRRVMGLSLAPPVEQAMQCRRLRERAAYWVQAAKVNRLAAARWHRTILNAPDWFRAVHEVQKAFPGTKGWLLSCSAAESSHGPWVRYGGSPYYQGYEYTNAVGGWLQYRWHTFRGHYRHGLDSLRSRGFRVTLPEPQDVRAWLMPVGQAIAGGWARWSGNDGSHWSASHGRGC